MPAGEVEADWGSGWKVLGRQSRQIPCRSVWSSGQLCWGCERLLRGEGHRGLGWEGRVLRGVRLCL